MIPTGSFERGAVGANPVASAPSPCAMCFHRRSCLPAVLAEDGASLSLQGLVGAPMRVPKGARLLRSGQAANRVYVLHNGAFKSLVGLADGRERIVGFHEAGDWLGLEGMSGAYRADLVALEPSQVCEIDLRRLETLATRVPALQRHLCRAMAQALVHAQGQQFALGSMHVRERLVRFLLELSRRYAERGLSPDEFTLRMSREDIGEYLGFRLETVSRVFTELHRAGIIALARRRVRLLDRAALLGILDGAARSELERAHSGVVARVTAGALQAARHAAQGKARLPDVVPA